MKNIAGDIILHMRTKIHNYVQFLRYGVRQTEFLVTLDYILPFLTLAPLIRDVSRDYLGIAVFIGRMTKRETEGIATLRSSGNIRHHNKI